MLSIPFNVTGVGLTPLYFYDPRTFREVTETTAAEYHKQ